MIRRVPAGLDHSTVLPGMDFETYSEAGYVWREDKQKWASISSSPPHGLLAVGASVYTEHPSCRVISLAYDLRDGRGVNLWLPGFDPPADLFGYLATGGLIAAWNSMFEYLVWSNVCVPRMGWPVLPLEQLRDTTAKARAAGLPGHLGAAGEAIRAPVQKLKDGTRLINKFSKPRNPTQKNPARRLLLRDDPIDGSEFLRYNTIDVEAETTIGSMVPDLSPTELDVWQLDQRINARGVAIDTAALSHCVRVVEQVHAEDTAELQQITGGYVESAAKLDKLKTWLTAQGVAVDSLDADAVANALTDDTPLPPDARRVLEIRASLSLSSVKKLFSMQRRISRDGRLRDLFAYCGAERTGRFAGRGPQPQNLPGGHPAEALPFILDDIAHLSLPALRKRYGDPLALVSGCLRGLFVAGPGHDIISADYHSIEAVGLAMLAGEQWQIDVFRSHGRIYEMTASQLFGVPFQEFLDHKEQTGKHHPLRKKGKIAALASGYQGSVGAYRRFGAEGTDEEILSIVRQWRQRNPNIVQFWYGLEDAARQAILEPGQCFSHRGITYGVRDDVLYCRLPSGRYLWYREPRLTRTTRFGREVLRISYMGKDVSGRWVRIDTYGGKLAENVTQASCRDILTHAMLHVEAAGYPIVLHVHDEIASEVPRGFGSVEELEHIMGEMPAWAADWPIHAAGGWRGHRYRKD